MRYADVERLCLSLPATSVHTPWNDSRVYKVDGKMFAMLAYDEKGRPGEVWFKAGEASFEILTRQKGIRPCPYLARAKWVAVDGLKVLPAKVLRGYLVRAHAQVAMGLSRKRRAALGMAEAPSRPT